MKRFLEVDLSGRAFILNISYKCLVNRRLKQDSVKESEDGAPVVAAQAET